MKTKFIIRTKNGKEIEDTISGNANAIKVEFWENVFHSNTFFISDNCIIRKDEVACISILESIE